MWTFPEFCFFTNIGGFQLWFWITHYELEKSVSGKIKKNVMIDWFPFVWILTAYTDV